MRSQNHYFNSRSFFFPEMVNKCCVPFCKSGYEAQKTRKKVHLFKFPDDDTQREAWVKNISRRGFTPTSFSRVCSLHFTSDCIRSASSDPRGRRSKLKKIGLNEGAIPTLFPNYPLSKRTTPPLPRSEAATSTSRLAMENESIMQSIEEFEASDIVHDLCELKSKYVDDNCKFGFIVSDEDIENHLLLLKLAQTSFGAPVIIFSLKVFSDLSFTAFNAHCAIDSKIFSDVMKSHEKIESYTDFLNLLSKIVNSKLPYKHPVENVVDVLMEYVENDENVTLSSAKKISFLCEQLLYTVHCPGPHHPFSTTLLTTAILWQGHSTACYQAILNDGLLTLPSLRTLRRISQSTNELRSNTKLYLREKASVLNEYERTVCLMFDEVYVNQSIEYDHGQFVGLATNQNLPATTVLCFLIKSLCSKFSDVVAAIPIRGIDVDLLKQHCLQVLQIVCDSGFDVVVLIADNHPVNRAFFTHLSTSLHEPCANPVNPEKKLFLLIDSIHVIKNLFNNFQKRKIFVFHSDCNFPTANFKHLESLFHLESSMSLRLAHKLSERVLCPANIQRMSAKLAMSLFHDSTIAALQYYAKNGHEDWQSTCDFMFFMNNLIKILNIRSSSVGVRRNDPLKLPISNSSDERLDSLVSYAEFFKCWRECKRAGMSQETSYAVENLCRNLRLLVIHLLEDRKFHFVLTGQITSDPIESRFGRYRQMAGGNYFISVKQLFDSERKIKLSSLLRHTGISVNALSEVELEPEPEGDSGIFFIDVADDDIPIDDNELQVIFYVSGYCAHSVTKRINCDECKTFFTTPDVMPCVDQPNDFFNFINRGRLKSPTAQLFTLLCHAYSLFSHLRSSHQFNDFLRLPSPVTTFITCVQEHYFYDLPFEGHCNHNLKAYWSRCVQVFFNCLSRNFIRSLQARPRVDVERKVFKLRSSKKT